MARKKKAVRRSRKRVSKVKPRKKLSKRPSSAPSSSYASLPKTTFQTKSIRIPLERESQPAAEQSPAVEAPAPEAWTAPVESKPTDPTANPIGKMHYYSSLFFLGVALWSFVFALKFAGEKNWLFFLISVGLFVIGADNVIVSLHKLHGQPSVGLPRHESTKLHRFCERVFCLLAITGGVFGLTFLLQGQWVMLLLSLAIVIIGVDNMRQAKRNCA